MKKSKNRIEFHYPTVVYRKLNTNYIAVDFASLNNENSEKNERLYLFKEYRRGDGGLLKLENLNESIFKEIVTSNPKEWVEATDLYSEDDHRFTSNHLFYKGRWVLCANKNESGYIESYIIGRFKYIAGNFPKEFAVIKDCVNLKTKEAYSLHGHCDLNSIVRQGNKEEIEQALKILHKNKGLDNSYYVKSLKIKDLNDNNISPLIKDYKNYFNEYVYFNNILIYNEEYDMMVSPNFDDDINIIYYQDEWAKRLLKPKMGSVHKKTSKEKEYEKESKEGFDLNDFNIKKIEIEMPEDFKFSLETNFREVAKEKILEYGFQPFNLIYFPTNEHYFNPDGFYYDNINSKPISVLNQPHKLWLFTSDFVYLDTHQEDNTLIYIICYDKKHDKCIIKESNFDEILNKEHNIKFVFRNIYNAQFIVNQLNNNLHLIQYYWFNSEFNGHDVNNYFESNEFNYEYRNDGNESEQNNEDEEDIIYENIAFEKVYDDNNCVIGLKSIDPETLMRKKYENNIKTWIQYPGQSKLEREISDDKIIYISRCQLNDKSKHETIKKTDDNIEINKNDYIYLVIKPEESSDTSPHEDNMFFKNLKFVRIKVNQIDDYINLYNYYMNENIEWKVFSNINNAYDFLNNSSIYSRNFTKKLIDQITDELIDQIDDNKLAYLNNLKKRL